MTPSSHRRRHRHCCCEQRSRLSSTSNATPQTIATGTSSRDEDGRICCTTRRCSRGRRHAPPPPHRRGPTSPRKWHAVSSRHPNTFPANIARRSLHPRSRIAILTLSSSSPLTREKAARWRMPRRSTATDGTAPDDYDVRPAWECVRCDVDCCRSLHRFARENPWAKTRTGIDKEHPGGGGRDRGGCVPPVGFDGLTMGWDNPTSTASQDHRTKRRCPPRGGEVIHSTRAGRVRWIEMGCDNPTPTASQDHRTKGRCPPRGREVINSTRAIFRIVLIIPPSLHQPPPPSLKKRW